MSAPHVAVVLCSGLTFHGYLLHRGPFRIVLALEDLARLEIRCRDVAAIATAPAPPEPNRKDPR